MYRIASNKRRFNKYGISMIKLNKLIDNWFIYIDFGNFSMHTFAEKHLNPPKYYFLFFQKNLMINLAHEK